MGNLSSLAGALVKAQAEMSGAKKESANPFFKSKYADLASVMEAIRPALSAHGLGFVQVCHDAPEAAIVETVIVHESGETMSCGRVSVPVTKADAQGYGSAISYARRYSLQTAFGVPSVDDDGNEAARAAPHGVTAKGIPKAGPAPHSATAEAWAMMDGETQKFLEGVAMDVISYLAKGRDVDAWERIEEAQLDNDQKAALWSRFDSKQRSTLKSIGAAAAQRVKEAA